MIEIPLADYCSVLRESATYCAGYVCCYAEKFSYGYNVDNSTLEVVITTRCILSDTVLEGVSSGEEGLISRLLKLPKTLELLREEIIKNCKECSQVDINSVLFDVEHSNAYIKYGEKTEKISIDREKIFKILEQFKQFLNKFTIRLSELADSDLGREILKACIKRVELVREKLVLKDLISIKLTITNVAMPGSRFTISDLLYTKVETKIEVKANFNVNPNLVNINLVKELLVSAISGYIIELAELAYRQICNER